MAEHTATPWDCFVDDEGTSVGAHSGGHRICIVRVSGSITNPHIQADINFLLGAVNNHERLRSALDGLLERYTDLANSGDAGFWDPETEREVVAARQVLAAVGPTQVSGGDRG